MTDFYIGDPASFIGEAEVGSPTDAPPEKPPFSRKSLPIILAAWAVAPILLWTNGFTIPETSANVPLNREWVYQVRDSWEPAVPPQQARRFVPQETAAAPEKTPYARPWVSTVTASWQVEQSTGATLPCGNSSTPASDA